MRGRPGQYVMEGRPSLRQDRPFLRQDRPFLRQDRPFLRQDRQKCLSYWRACHFRARFEGVLGRFWPENGVFGGRF